MDPSPALEARIRELASHLEKHSSHILRGRVVIEPPSAHHRIGQFSVTLEISVPGEEIAVRAEPSPDDSHRDDPYATVNDAFHTARRRLDDYEAKRHHDVKSHSLPK
jgi:ribosome-associated translation inhibitor RaiA